MEITSTSFYAFFTAGTFFLLLFFRFRHIVDNCNRKVRLFLRWVSYIRILPRFSLVGPWRLITTLLQVLFLATNVYITFFNGLFKSISAKEASLRAANLLMINLTLVTAGPSLSFLASILGLPLKTFRKIHISLALTSLLCLIFHIFTTIANKRELSLHVISNRWALAVRGQNCVCHIYWLTVLSRRRSGYLS